MTPELGSDTTMPVGHVGIGTTSPAGLLDVQATSTGGGYAAYLYNNGNTTSSNGVAIRAGNSAAGGANVLLFQRGSDGTTIGSVSQATASTVAYNTTSDRRLKENIVDSTLGVDALSRIRVRDYNYISDGEKLTLQGFIAQELNDVYGHDYFANAPCRPEVEAAGRDGRLFLAPISMWEIAMKAAKGKLALSSPTLEWIHLSKQRSRIHDAPITAEIAVDSVCLPGSFHNDPADRLIIATARNLDAFLVTRDAAILAYAEAGFVKVWRL